MDENQDRFLDFLLDCSENAPITAAVMVHGIGKGVDADHMTPIVARHAAMMERMQILTLKALKSKISDGKCPDGAATPCDRDCSCVEHCLEATKGSPLTDVEKECIGLACREEPKSEKVPVEKVPVEKMTIDQTLNSKLVDVICACSAQTTVLSFPVATGLITVVVSRGEAAERLTANLKEQYKEAQSEKKE